MPKSPRKETSSTAVKPKMTAVEALLKARQTGEGPVFSVEQQSELSALCKLKNVDPVEFLTIYTLYVIRSFSPSATGPELVACVEAAVTRCPEPTEIIALYKQRKSGRQPSGEDPLVKLERMYQALLAEREKSKNTSLYNERTLQLHEDTLHMAWQSYVAQLKVATAALGWTPEKRQEAWDKGHSALTSSLYDYVDRRKQLKAEKIRKKAEEAAVEVRDLIDLAEQVDVTGDPKDMEELIDENGKQAETLDSIADETADMEFIDDLNVH